MNEKSPLSVVEWVIAGCTVKAPPTAALVATRKVIEPPSSTLALLTETPAFDGSGAGSSSSRMHKTCVWLPLLFTQIIQPMTLGK